MYFVDVYYCYTKKVIYTFHNSQASYYPKLFTVKTDDFYKGWSSTVRTWIRSTFDTTIPRPY